MYWCHQSTLNVCITPKNRTSPSASGVERSFRHTIWLPRIVWRAQSAEWSSPHIRPRDKAGRWNLHSNGGLIWCNHQWNCGCRRLYMWHIYILLYIYVYIYIYYTCVHVRLSTIMCAPKMNKANTKPESFLDGSPQTLTRGQNWVVDTYANNGSDTGNVAATNPLSCVDPNQKKRLGNYIRIEWERPPRWQHKNIAAGHAVFSALLKLVSM